MQERMAQSETSGTLARAEGVRRSHLPEPNHRTKPTGIIWDVDGTLCDTLPLCIAAFRAVYARRLGRAFSDEEIVAGFGASEAGVLQALIPEDWAAAEQEYIAEYVRLHDQFARVFPGVLDVLEGLQARGVRQAVVTGKGPRSAAITLERLELAPYFDHVESGSAEGPVKPQGIRAVLAAWQVAPENAAYVGDTPYDAAAALEVGVRPCALRGPGLLAAWPARNTTMRPGEPTSALILPRSWRGTTRPSGRPDHEEK